VAPGVELERNDILNLIFVRDSPLPRPSRPSPDAAVGMDVVRRNIERLRGKIEIETAVGTGSTYPQ